MLEITKMRRNKIKKMQEPITVWLCFVVRVFIIHVTLGGDSGHSSRGLQELKIAGIYPQAAIDKHLAFQVDKRSPFWTDACELGITQASEHIRTWILKDQLAELHSELSYGGKPNDKPKYNLMRAHSLWCGILMFWLRLTLWESGTFLADCWTALVPVMHLYNAVRQMSNMPTWEEMEYLIK